jgi:hypothetical protein
VTADGQNRTKAAGLAFGLVAVFLACSEASARELYILRHVRDAVCRTFPCPNWSGVNSRTGETFKFDTLFDAKFATPARRAEFERASRAGGALVEGEFKPVGNRLNLDWSSEFQFLRFVRSCESAESCAP